MKRLVFRVLLVLLVSVSSPGIYGIAVGAGAPQGGPQQCLSLNIPLDSYVYGYLDKLAGLGYLPEMRLGVKPYTRLQAAHWVEKINAQVNSRGDIPDYAADMLAQLNQEFEPELQRLAGGPREPWLGLREWTASGSYYHGDTLKELGTKASWQPLNTNNSGYRLADGGNWSLAARLEAELAPALVASVTPRVATNRDSTDVSLTAGYVKTQLNNVEIQVGKEDAWWGQGVRGSRSLTNNAAPVTSLKLSNIDAMNWGFLGPTYVTMRYSVLENDRSDVKYPSLVGLRCDFIPSNNFTFGLSRLDIVGGAGRMLTRSDLKNLIFGTNSDAAGDKWNTQAGGDFRWRLGNGVEVYGEVYGEDQSGYMPSQLSELAGVYIPKLNASGDWEARLEFAHTLPCWYTHSVYTNGWVYKDNILGDYMGSDADRYYGQLAHYLPGGAQFSLNLEHLIQNATGSGVQQKVDSFWLAAEQRLAPDVLLRAEVGVARVLNTNYHAGLTSHTGLASLTITEEFF